MSETPASQQIKVNIDITGFYFSATIDVASGATVEAAMRQLSNKQIVTNNGKKAILQFSRDTRDFLTSIEINYLDAPQSRQKRKSQAVASVMPDESNVPNLLKGTYGATDAEPLVLKSGKGLLTWQYYVNAASFEGDKVTDIGVLLNGRTPGNPKDRVIEPFGRFQLTQNCLVTWRLIVIATGPAETLVAAYA